MSRYDDPRYYFLTDEDRADLRQIEANCRRDQSRILTIGVIAVALIALAEVAL